MTLPSLNSTIKQITNTSVFFFIIPHTAIPSNIFTNSLMFKKVIPSSHFMHETSSGLPNL